MDLSKPGKCRSSWYLLVFVIAFSVLISPASICAAPFADFFKFTQPDNKQITLWGEGDDFHAVFETTTGYTVVFDPQQKAYFYATRSADGKELLSTGVFAHDQVPAGLTLHLRADPDAVAATAKAKQKKMGCGNRIIKTLVRAEVAKPGDTITP